MRYEVLVGNVGTVLRTSNNMVANAEFNRWVVASKAPHGRCAGENVTLFSAGEIKREYTPKVTA